MTREEHDASLIALYLTFHRPDGHGHRWWRRLAQRRRPEGGVKPKVAFIGTGGTIASLGAGPLDILDYGASENRMQADAIAAMFPQWNRMRRT